jgi:SAM-dependent methyltransferase
MPVDEQNFQCIPKNASLKDLAHFKLYEWAGNQLPGGWVVEIGSEMGFGLPLLEREVRKLIGLEIRFGELLFSKFATQSCQVPIRISADASAIPLPEDSMSGVCMLNVLHLVPSPEIVLDECRRVLKTNHPLVIAVPTDYNLPDAWRIPNEKEHLRGLVKSVFSNVEMSYADDRIEVPVKNIQGEQHGWLAAICTITE